MANSIKITKAMRFEDLKALVQGEKMSHNSTVEDLVAFIDHEVALLAKKNASDKKPTKVQEENENYMQLILSFLSNQAQGVTCTEVLKGVVELNDFNNQKVAALMRKLLADGKVTKEVVKGKSLFKIAEGE